MIRDLSDIELPEAAALAAAAFREDAGFSHILPDDALRRWRLPSILEAMLRVDSACGGQALGAFDGGALVGVASVLPASATEPDLADWTRELPRLGWLAAYPAALLRALGIRRAIESVRPKTLDYLNLLAVHPATQGRGVGAALLNAAPKTLYLETFEKRNADWYGNRGFRLTGEVQSPVRPTFWTLRRSR
ncbi:MAG: GNAT family N-acetyltransferase [Elusimicrobia bacterium]|nr:GNAT family N-acetyltransferase [Elusimicrobiota bacterium]